MTKCEKKLNIINMVMAVILFSTVAPLLIWAECSFGLFVGLIIACFAGWIGWQIPDDGSVLAKARDAGLGFAFIIFFTIAVIAIEYKTEFLDLYMAEQSRVTKIERDEKAFFNSLETSANNRGGKVIEDLLNSIDSLSALRTKNAEVYQQIKHTNKKSEWEAMVRNSPLFKQYVDGINHSYSTIVQVLGNKEDNAFSAIVAAYQILGEKSNAEVSVPKLYNIAMPLDNAFLITTLILVIGFVIRLVFLKKKSIPCSQE